MGQYFKFVNLDKKEFIDPHKLDSGAKFWEILSSTSATRVFSFLMRQSTEKEGEIYTGKKGEPKFREFRFKYCGRWAGDRVSIVGDYDDSKIYELLYEGTTHRSVIGENVKEIPQSKIEFVDEHNSYELEREEEDKKLFKRLEKNPKEKITNEPFEIREPHFINESELFTDITEKTLKEFNKFIELPEFQIVNGSIVKPDRVVAQPDMLISSEGIQVGKKIVRKIEN